MADLFLLSRVQMRRIERYFPLSHGIARVDDRRIVSAIVFVIKNGLRWRDAPRDYGPHKTIYNRFDSLEPPGRVQQDFRRTGGLGRKVGADLDRGHASQSAPHRCQPFVKRACSPTYRAHQRRSELQAARLVCDSGGRRSPVMLLSEGQMSDYKGAALMLPAMPKAVRNFSPTRATMPIGSAPPSQSAAASPPASPRNPIGRSRSPMTPSSTSKRHKIGKNMFGRLKDWAPHPHPDTTAAPTPTCRQSVSPQPSPSGSDQSSPGPHSKVTHVGELVFGRRQFSQRIAGEGLVLTICLPRSKRRPLFAISRELLTILLFFYNKKLRNGERGGNRTHDPLTGPKKILIAGRLSAEGNVRGIE